MSDSDDFTHIGDDGSGDDENNEKDGDFTDADDENWSMVSCS
jgi:hypothetical protein